MTALLVVGNWKMHGTQFECRNLARGVARGLKRTGRQFALKGLGKSAIDNFEIAYEPVWAIGTGLNAASEQIARVHGRIRQFLKAFFGNRKRNAARIL